MSSASGPVLPSARADQLSYYGRSTGWKARRSLWILVPLLSAGIASWAVFVWFALETKSAIFWWASVLSLGLVVAGFALSTEAPWLLLVAWLGSVVFSLAVNKRLQVFWSWNSAESERALSVARIDEARMFADLQAAQMRFLAADRAIRERDRVISQWQVAYQREADERQKVAVRLNAAVMAKKQSEATIEELRSNLKAVQVKVSRAETNPRGSSHSGGLVAPATTAESALAAVREQHQRDLRDSIQRALAATHDEHRRELEAAELKSKRLEGDVARLRTGALRAEDLERQLRALRAKAEQAEAASRVTGAVDETQLNAARATVASHEAQLRAAHALIEQLGEENSTERKAATAKFQSQVTESARLRTQASQLEADLRRAEAKAERHRSRVHGVEAALAAAEADLASLREVVPVLEAPSEPSLTSSAHTVDEAPTPVLTARASVQGDPKVRSLVDSVLTSEVYRRQHARAGRAALAETVVRNLLTELLLHGGKMNQTSLAVAVGVDRERLGPTLKVLRRLLNIDGYPVVELVVDEGVVLLNAALLGEQFGVAAS